MYNKLNLFNVIIRTEQVSFRNAPNHRCFNGENKFRCVENSQQIADLSADFCYPVSAFGFTNFMISTSDNISVNICNSAYMLGIVRDPLSDAGSDLVKIGIRIVHRNTRFARRTYYYPYFYSSMYTRPFDKDSIYSPLYNITMKCIVENQEMPFIHCNNCVTSYYPFLDPPSVKFSNVTLIFLFSKIEVRSLYEREIEGLSKSFPGLNLTSLKVIGEVSPFYNGISWSAWPKSLSLSGWMRVPYRLKSADKLYESLGYRRTRDNASAVIDLWCYKRSSFAISIDSSGNTDVCKIFHVSVLIKLKNKAKDNKHGYEQVWSSKFGSGPLVIHSREAFIDIKGRYGYHAYIGASYRLNSSIRGENREIKNMSPQDKITKIMTENNQVEALENQKMNYTFKFSDYIGEQDIKYIKARALKVDKSIQENFKELYASWETACLNNIAITRNDDIDKCVAVRGFQELVKLGNSTIPLYMEKLAQQDFLAIVPYKSVQLNREYLPTERTYSDQMQAIGALQSWILLETNPDNGKIEELTDLSSLVGKTVEEVFGLEDHE